MRFTYIIMWLTLVLPLAAQSGISNSDLTIKQKNIVLDKNGLTADVEVDITQLELPSQAMLVLTPCLESLEGNETYTFDPITIAGNKRLKVMRRSDMLSGNNTVGQVLKYSKNEAQIFPLHLTVSFLPWMKKARLVFKKQQYGCADCDLGEGQHVITLPSVEPYIPQYSLSYVVPEAELVKERSLKHTAQFNYKVGRSDLLPEYSNNAVALREVKKVIDDVHKDKNVTINSVSIIGYASPEGSYESNMTLSEKRAKSFAEHLRQAYSFDQKILSIQWKGEDWAGLRDAVASSSLSDREQVLSLIDNVNVVTEREKRLMALSGGATYRTLLADYYPRLRRNDLILNFVVKAFDVEEAKEIIRTHPQYLSLNEMYLVANSYPKDSKEFKEVFDIASRLYPADKTANTNAAVVELENGSIDRAIERLNGINTPDAWNNLGIAYARKGEFEKAQEQFKKAANAGHINAEFNLTELQKSQEN